MQRKKVTQALFLEPPPKMPGIPCSPILSQEKGVVWFLGIPDLDRDGEEEISAVFFFFPPGTSLTGSLGKEEPI